MKINIRIICLVALVVIITRNNCIATDLVYGPYEVGFKTYKTYDDSRLYILGENTISRPLLIHIWYPSQEILESQTLKFKDYIDLIAQREDYGKSMSEIDKESFSYVRAYSDFAKSNFGLDTSIKAQFILDSPVYAKSGISIQNEGSEFPLLIYAPSNSKASVQNHMLCEYLASHGFIIISVASAGPNSIQRNSFEESTMAQVIDMEYILRFCEDSLKMKYKSLGLFGFSSGGNAMTIFQMRNKDVGAVLSLDGGQEYGTFIGLYSMPDFDLEKANVPYLSMVNNYENFSIYPMYNSINSTERFLYRMPYLNHNGFISYWSYFNSCSPDKNMSNSSISFTYLSEYAVRFFSKYLKSETSVLNNNSTDELTNKYIQPVKQDYSSINALCKTLLNYDLDSATSLIELHKEVLFGGANQVNLLARMFSDNDQAVWLYQKGVAHDPKSWEAHYNLGHIYKEKGETILAKNALLKAQELDPENSKINDLLIELKKKE